MVQVGQPAQVRFASADVEMMARAAPKKAAKKVVKKAAPKKAAPKPKKAAPARKAATGVVGDIGVTPPLGLFDPLGFLSRGPETYRRYQEIEIKHGRLAMAATLGVIVTEAGIRFPGYISYSQDLQFADVPAPWTARTSGS